MSGKGGKTALKVLYFVILFAVGAVLAVSLPNLLLYRYGVDGIRDQLASGTYSASVLPLSGYFNNVPAVRESLGEGKGFVVFEGAFVGYRTDEAEGTQTPELRKAYAVYLYGVGSEYNTAAKDNNLTMVRVTTAAGEVIEYPVLDYDLDGNGTVDANATMQEKGFLCVQLDSVNFGSVSQIAYYDKDGNLFHSFPTALTYESAFFTDVQSFIDVYDAGMTEEQFTKADTEFRAKSEHYLMGSVDEHRKKAVTVSFILIIAYFALVYIVYDLTLGQRRLIRLGRLILEKVFRVDFSKYDEKKRLKEMGAEALVYGKDYYCKVTLTLDLEAVPDFRESAAVRYTGSSSEDGESGDVEFLFNPTDGYSCTRRIHAGVYRNPWIEMDRAYAAEDLPDNLVAEGYTMEIKIKILPNSNERAGNQS